MPLKKQDKPSKTVQSIRMLKILKSRKYVKKEEIASLLGENTIRNINNYKNALYDAGYLIDYKPGIYGGYYLMNDTILPLSNVKKDQLEALSNIFKYVEKDKNFINREIFLDFISNILASNDDVTGETNDMLFGYFPLSMSTEELQKRFFILQTAIDSKRKVEIIYKGYKSDVKRIILPYKLYKFQNWHVYAYDTRVVSRERVIGYNSFKLHRIKEITLLDEVFRWDPNYDETEHFTKRGLYKDQPIHVKLRLFPPLARSIDEKIYGDNQKVEFVNKSRGEYLFEADMYDRFVVLKFVLSLGDSCRVLEPEWLKKAVIYQANRLIEFYKRDT